jgi:general secretion pathway protein G
MIHKKTKRKTISFTLVEIMVVIGIMMLLFGIALPFAIKSLGKGRVAAAKMQIQSFDTAITSFRIDTGKLPQSLDDLIKNNGDKKWDGPYLKKKEIPKDPWGHEFVYEISSDNPNGYTITSYGSDGAPGGEKQAADLTN